MPGVADAIKQTELIQQQRQRKQAMQQLLQLVKEGRLHEADEYQLETLRLAVELNSVLEEKFKPKAENSTQEIDPELIAKKVAEEVGKVLSQLPTSALPHGAPAVGGQIAQPALGARPEMRHVNLTELKVATEDLQVSDSGKLVNKNVAKEDKAANKLSTLKKLRGERPKSD